MTGFGKACAETPTKKITVEIKSLNSKQLDLSMRMPGLFREYELGIRSYISHILERGKVDVTVTVETTATSSDTGVSLNMPALHNYREQINKACEELNIPEPADWFNVLMRFPDSICSETAAAAADEVEGLNTAVKLAVDGLMAHRRAEGEALEKFFAQRIENIAGLLKSIEPFEKERVERIKQRLIEGLSKIPAIDFDKGRLEQELIFYIEKLDVNEEKQRLGRHLSYFIETMELSTPGQGKKLGFIAQEMGREINTLGSKSNQAEMQAIVVKMKDALEQIKEQVLNVM